MIDGYDSAILEMPSKACIPQGLEADMEDLFVIWSKVRVRNSKLREYYTQHNAMVAISDEDDITDVDVQEVVGWPKSAVDSLASRSILDGFLFEGVEDAEFNKLVRENALDTDLYPQALVSALTYGLGWFTVMKGNKGQPKAMVRHFSAMQGAGKWDKDNRCLKCGIVLNDADKEGRACKYTAFWPDAVYVFTKNELGWECVPMKSSLGIPLMVPLVYDPDADRPLGHSRITPEIIATTNRAMRQLLNLDVGCESYVWPQRWMTGVDDDLFEERDEDGNVVKVNRSRRSVYMGKILALTRDEDGNLPNVGQFSQSDVTPLVKAYEQAAQQISGATHLPINELGVLSSNYTSSDALKASTSALELDVERMNRRNKSTMELIAKMMMAIAEGKTMEDLDDTQKSVQANFRNPSMPTMSAATDAAIKIAASDEGYAGSRSFYEHAGWSSSEIDSYFAEKRQTGAINALNIIAENMSKNGDTK